MDISCVSFIHYSLLGNLFGIQSYKLCLYLFRYFQYPDILNFGDDSIYNCSFRGLSTLCSLFGNLLLFVGLYKRHCLIVFCLYYFELSGYDLFLCYTFDLIWNKRGVLGTFRKCELSKYRKEDITVPYNRRR